MSASPTRVLVVEDDARFRARLSSLLTAHGFEIQEAASGAEAVRVLAQFQADVCLIDLGLPDTTGEALIPQLQQIRPNSPSLVLTAASTRSKILQAVRAGAVGYLLKEDLQQVAAALTEALAGGAPMSREVARVVLAQVKSSPPEPPVTRPETALTSREIEVVEALSRGLTYANVAVALSISTNTVRQHVRSIYYKLSVASKTEAVLEALRLGVIRGDTSAALR